MWTIEEHRSPDGLLQLVVRQAEDGDIIIGFDGYPWHTHPDCEDSKGDLSDSEAIRPHGRQFQKGNPSPGRGGTAAHLALDLD
jgi:hypothetical protein